MSSTSNPKVTIIDEDGFPAEVTSNGLKVDVGSNIELTVGDVVTAKQDDPSELKVLLYGEESVGGYTHGIRTNSDGKITLDPASVVNMTGLVYADTELKPSAVLEDDTVNPTITQISSYPMVYDGSTWDRMRGTSADGLLVNLGSNNDVANNDPDDMKVGIWGNTEIDGTGTYRIPEVSATGNLHVSVQNTAIRTEGAIVDNDPIGNYPVTIGAKVFGNDWSGADTIHAGDAVHLITDMHRVLWVSEKPSQTWSEGGPFTLDGTQETLSDLMGVTETDLKEIIIQASIDNTGYVSVVTESAATLGDGIRMDAGDLLTLRISDNRPIAVIGSDATQKINIMTI